MSKSPDITSSFGIEFTIHAPHIDSRIEGLKIDFSTNAFITSNVYGLSMEDYFELGGCIHQMHLHDNFGILESEEAMFGDRHLPLGLGKIEIREVFKNILKTNARNLILEVKNAPKEYTRTSLTQIREFCSLTPIFVKCLCLIIEPYS